MRLDLGGELVVADGDDDLRGLTTGLGEPTGGQRELGDGDERVSRALPMGPLIVRPGTRQ